MKTENLSFAQVGEIFDDATTRLVGGVTDQNRNVILNDLQKVQTGLEHLLEKSPADFQGVAGIHTQNVIDQLNLEMAAIKSVGTNPFAAKYINDVQRDLIDIIQGDDHLVALATQGNHNGFAAVPHLLVAPAQFQGNAEQTQFMQDFITVTQDFGDRAVALAANPADTAGAQQLAGEIMAYAAAANHFTVAQGGLYSARFDNEFAENGVNGTASRALADGLLTGNADKVSAAAEVLAANAADVAGNMLGIGVDPPPSNGNGIPAEIDTLAKAGIVFNDATAKLIGGVYEGNRQSIHDDLTATQEGLKGMLSNDQFDGKTEVRAKQIVDLLGRELKIVDNEDAGPNAGNRLNDIHSKIIDIVQRDPTLAAAADDGDANGFMALPGTLKGGPSGGNGGGHDGGHDRIAAAAPAAGATPATHADLMPGDVLAHIFQVDGVHHQGG